MKAIQIFIFGNIYISLCAVLMVIFTDRIFNLNSESGLYLFVFFATLTSYSFHWYLTPDVHSSSQRYIWVKNNKILLLVLFVLGVTGVMFFIYTLRDHLLVLFFMSALTFFYSASKIPFRPFIYLKRIIIGKTIYLAFVWTFVTVILPLILNGRNWDPHYTIFILNRFFLIFPVCLLFDYRDRDEDREQNIKNIVGIISLKALRIFYYTCLLFFFIFAFILLKINFSPYPFIILVVPGFFLLFSFGYSIKTKSDYWYYFYLDGLMMMSPVLFFIQNLITS